MLAPALGRTHLCQMCIFNRLLIYPIFHSGDVSAQLTAAPPTCPGDTFSFRCTVTGDMNGITIWRVGGSSDCNLVHRISSFSICGPSDDLTAISETGFGTSTTSYTSTLSGTATPTLNGILVECFGPANNIDPGNRVGSSTLQILGQWSSICRILCDTIVHGILEVVLHCWYSLARALKMREPLSKVLTDRENLLVD